MTKTPAKKIFEVWCGQLVLAWAPAGHSDIAPAKLRSASNIQVLRIILVPKSIAWVKGKREKIDGTFVYPPSAIFGPKSVKVDSRKKIFAVSSSEFSAESEKHSFDICSVFHSKRFSFGRTETSKTPFGTCQLHFLEFLFQFFSTPGGRSVV